MKEVEKELVELRDYVTVLKSKIDDKDAEILQLKVQLEKYDNASPALPEATVENLKGVFKGALYSTFMLNPEQYGGMYDTSFELFLPAIQEYVAECVKDYRIENNSLQAACDEIPEYKTIIASKDAEIAQLKEVVKFIDNNGVSYKVGDSVTYVTGNPAKKVLTKIEFGEYATPVYWKDGEEIFCEPENHYGFFIKGENGESISAASVWLVKE